MLLSETTSCLKIASQDHSLAFLSAVGFLPLETGISKVRISERTLCTQVSQVGLKLLSLTLCLHHFLSLNLALIWSSRAIGTLFKGSEREAILDMRAGIFTPHWPSLRKMQISKTKQLYKETHNISVIMQNSILSRSPCQDHEEASVERSVTWT